MKKHLNISGVALALALLTGCGPSVRYDYVMPVGASGRACVMQCRTQMNQCESLARLAWQNQNLVREMESRSYQNCSQGKSKKEARKACSYPSSHYFSPSYSTYECSQDYNSCFTDICGGTIRKVIEEP